jgi:hypothetical protein
MSDETWLTDRKVDASKKKFFVATEIIVFDFELFIGEHRAISTYGRTDAHHVYPRK